MTDSAADGTTARRSRPDRTRRPARPGLIALAIGIGLVVLLCAAAGWLAFRALTAKAELENAKELVSLLSEQATSLDFAGVGATSDQLSAATGKAVRQAHDPLWRAAEILPVVGANLTAVREMAEAVDLVARDAVAPISTVASGLSATSLKPVEGKLDLAPLVDLNAALTTASAALSSAATSAADIQLSGTVGQVSAAGAELTTMLERAATTVAEVSAVASVAPDMLGASGPRTYVLVFQNLAETTALGGTAAALTEVTVDDGQISIARQASSASFGTRNEDPALAVDPELAALFTPLIYTRLNLATSRPDFPTAAQITQAFWQRDIGGTIDGVISVDPVALSHMLGATGPVTMSTGDVLSQGNAVALLLNEIYLRHPGDTGPITDAFFAEAARRMFEAVMTSDAEPQDMVKAVSLGVTQHRIMAWSAHPEEQAILAGSPLAGILPATNESSTTAGVFFRDTSTSKMDFYLETAATLSTDACTAAAPTFTTSVDLHSTITPERAASLPWFIASKYWGGDQFRTEVYVYGPPGTTFASSSIDAADDAGGEVGAVLLETTTDLGRPVAKFIVMLTPGAKSTISATFNGPDGTYATPALRTTPMLNPTEVTVDAPGCK